MVKNTDTTEQSTGLGKRQMYSETKYRMGKYKGTASYSTEWENTQTQQAKYKMGKHTNTAS